MKKIKLSKGLTCLFAFFMMFFSFSVSSMAANEKTEPLPLESDTTLGDVQQHFSPETYEKTDEELKGEADDVLMEDAVKKGISPGKILALVTFASIAFLMFSFASSKDDKKEEKKAKRKKHKK